MKIGEFKLIATCTKKSVSIAFKKKNGLLFTVVDTNSNIDLGTTSGFTFYLGAEFAQTSILNKKTKRYIEIVLPRSGDRYVMKLVSKDAYKKFVQTDYKGFQLSK